MKIPVIIKDVNRLPNSINGNPQYKLITNSQAELISIEKTDFGGFLQDLDG